jgi:hypothetical protein
MSLKLPSDNVSAAIIAAKQPDFAWIIVTHFHAALYHTTTLTIGALVRERFHGQVAFPVK